MGTALPWLYCQTISLVQVCDQEPNFLPLRFVCGCVRLTQLPTPYQLLPFVTPSQRRHNTWPRWRHHARYYGRRHLMQHAQSACKEVMVLLANPSARIARDLDGRMVLGNSFGWTLGTGT